MQKLLIIALLLALNISFCFGQNQSNIPKLNQQVIDTVIKYGALLSPTYEKQFVLNL